MSTALGRLIVDDFVRNSASCIQAIVEAATRFPGTDRKIPLYTIKNNQVKEVVYSGRHFYVRSSVEYSNPQLTVEELQGIIAARLIEVFGNHFKLSDVQSMGTPEVDDVCEFLSNPPSGKIVSFLLNTDDVEPDRYSMNPLKESIVQSGQSAFPSASVQLEGLHVDQTFFKKYEGTLISKDEIDLIEYYLNTCDTSYLDMVDAVKTEQLRSLSQVFGIDLCLPSMRMPLSLLRQETDQDLLHYIIQRSHKDYATIEQLYACMGRSMKKRRTLLTVPHAEAGYGSKRAARGRIAFNDAQQLHRIRVRYRTTPLYPNAIDPKDVSIVQAHDQFTIDGERLRNYKYVETPSSPQFILYSLASPENAVIWHGVGAFGASQLVKSYTTIHHADGNDLLKDLSEKFGLPIDIPLQFNLVPRHMWVHPVHDNIDASVGCVRDMSALAKMGLRIECLTTKNYIRRRP